MSCPVIELSMQLIRCQSISPNDAGCQEIIINRLQEIGFSIEYMNFIETKNFWAWHGGHGETLAFAGHTDVVPVGNIDLWINHPFEPTICNGILFGRGAADMKGSLAAMIVAAERFVLSHPNHKGRLAFLITSNEETITENGTAKVIETLKMRNEQIDYCLIGEPSSTKVLGDVIKNGCRGSLSCNLTVHGIYGRLVTSSLIDNLVYRTISMVNELMTVEWDKGNEFFPPTSMQITNIQTETTGKNMTPSSIILQLNFRFNNELTDRTIKMNVISLLKKYKLYYEINWKLFGHPFLTKHNKLTEVVIKTILHYNEIIPKLTTTGETSDARFIAKMGGQILEFGPVNTTIHKINECVHAADLQLLARMYQRIMEQLLT